ncbi:MAG: hypothetical protein R2788_20990 [Saprospiraceae bacterium]
MAKNNGVQSVSEAASFEIHNISSNKTSLPSPPLLVIILQTVSIKLAFVIITETYCQRTGSWYEFVLASKYPGTNT